MRRTIGARLVAGFMAVFIIMAIAGAVGLGSVQKAQKQYQQLAEQLLPAQASVAALSVQVYQMSTYLQGFVLYQDPAQLKRYEAARAQAEAMVQRAVQLPLAPADREDLQQLEELVRRLKSGASSVTQMTDAGDHFNTAARQIADLVRTIRTSTDTAASAARDVTSEVAKGTQQAQSAGEALEQIVAAMDGVAAQARSMAEGVDAITVHTAEVSQAVTAASAITEENLAATTQMHGNAVRVTEAMHGLAQSLDATRQTGGEVLQGAGAVTAAAAAVSGSVDKLSAVTEALRSLGHRFKL
jgi:CHASE3 domain sensor protein